MRSPGRSVSTILEKLAFKVDRLLFRPLWEQGAHLRRWTVAVGLLGLYLGGAHQWFSLLAYDEFSFRVGDWCYEHRFYSVLKEAISTFQIPFYTSSPFHDNDRFLSFVNIPFSPQVILLKFLEIKEYLVFNLLFLYTLCFHGCLLIARKYKLSICAFALLFIFVNFNGHVTSHIAIGHTQWFAYFLLPYFFYLTLEIRSNYFPRRVALWLGALLFFILLQGAIHFYIPSCLFLLILVLSNYSHRNLWRYLEIVVLSTLLAACRLVPALVGFGDKPRMFLAGYASFYDIVEQMTILFPNELGTGDRYPPVQWLGASVREFPWEYDIYIGLAGSLFLALAGIVLRFGDRLGVPVRAFKNLDWPIASMTWLSIGPNFYFVVAMGIPFVSTTERIPSRFIVWPLLALLTVAVVRLQALLERRWCAVPLRLLSLILTIHTAFLVRLHFFNWRTESMESYFAERVVELGAAIVSGEDTAYERVVLASLGMTLAAVVFWLWLFRRSREEQTLIEH